MINRGKQNKLGKKKPTACSAEFDPVKSPTNDIMQAMLQISPGTKVITSSF